MVGAGEQVDGGLVVEPDDADDEEGQQIGQDLAGRSSRSLPVACTRMPTILVAAMVVRPAWVAAEATQAWLLSRPQVPTPRRAVGFTAAVRTGRRRRWARRLGALLSLVSCDVAVVAGGTAEVASRPASRSRPTHAAGATIHVGGAHRSHLLLPTIPD